MPIARKKARRGDVWLVDLGVWGLFNARLISCQGRMWSVHLAGYRIVADVPSRCLLKRVKKATKKRKGAN